VRVKTAPENATVLALCEECGISRRTLFRDLKLLREVGVRITYDDRTGSFRIDSIDLDKTEQKSA
jgi:predicted DNA-binding transcriptional regulator YafY